MENDPNAAPVSGGSPTPESNNEDKVETLVLHRAEEDSAAAPSIQETPAPASTPVADPDPATEPVPVSDSSGSTGHVRFADPISQPSESSNQDRRGSESSTEEPPWHAVYYGPPIQLRVLPRNPPSVTTPPRRRDSTRGDGQVDGRRRTARSEKTQASPGASSRHHHRRSSGTPVPQTTVEVHPLFMVPTMRASHIEWQSPKKKSKKDSKKGSK